MDPSTPALPAELLPAELAGHTVESLFAMHGPDRGWIYWVMLAGFAGTLASLPLVEVDVGVRAPGIAKATTDRVELKTTVSGRIGEVLVRDNELVSEGQPLVVLATDELDEQLRRQRVLWADKSAQIGDLARMLAGAHEEVGTTAWRHEVRQFEAQRESYRLAEAKAGSELMRYAVLAEKGIATRQELDNVRYEAERLRAEAELFRQQADARWAARLKEEQERQDDIASVIRRLEQERAEHVLKAPVSGVLVGFQGWSRGGRILAGQGIGAISPADALRVESQVSTRDIGLVRVGQRVRLQIDAFPYTHWGMLEGRVESIGADLLAGAAGVPGYFKVVIRPLSTRLVSPSGQRAELRKGLTLTVRYVVARRCLLQILYDDASAWLDPHGAPIPQLNGYP